MHYPYQMFKDNMVVGWYGVGCKLQNNENGRWLQYTGLRDKNGAGIYEGDILRGQEFDRGHDHEYSCFNEKGEQVCDSSIYTNYEVKFATLKGFYIEVNHHISLRDFNAKEIVGNIYENPELI